MVATTMCERQRSFPSTSRAVTAISSIWRRNHTVTEIISSNGVTVYRASRKHGTPTRASPIRASHCDFFLNLSLPSSLHRSQSPTRHHQTAREL